MKAPGEQYARLIGGVLIVLAILTIAGFIYWRGKHSANFANVSAQLKTTEESAGISRETADTVGADQAESFAHYQQDQGAIRARIDAQPRAAGPADPDILRIAREAHARAVCAAGRVQRAQCSDDPTGAAGQ